MASLPKRKGLTCAHLLESQQASVPQTTEQKIRGGDAAAEAALLIGGYDAEAVKAVVANELQDELFGMRIAGLYRPAYSLTPRDKP